MATPPPQQTTPVPPTPQTTPTTAARVSLLTAGEQWSPTMKVQIEPASGRLLLLKQATGSSKERQEQEEECVAMVDLKMVVAEAVLCSEQEATAAGGGGKKADGKEGRNVVNMRVGGKTLMMRVRCQNGCSCKYMRVCRSPIFHRPDPFSAGGERGHRRRASRGR